MSVFLFVACSPLKTLLDRWIAIPTFHIIINLLLICSNLKSEQIVDVSHSVVTTAKIQSSLWSVYDRFISLSGERVFSRSAVYLYMRSLAPLRILLCLFEGFRDASIARRDSSDGLFTLAMLWTTLSWTESWNWNLGLWNSGQQGRSMANFSISQIDSRKW